MSEATVVLLFALAFVIGIAWLGFHPEFGAPTRREWPEEASDTGDVWLNGYISVLKTIYASHK